jgi:DNA-binding NtrC family response regulator
MTAANKGLILIVDDEDVLRRALVRALEEAGYAVIQASAGSDAVRLVEAHAIDVVVSDVSMPNMSGHELLLAIKQRAPDLPVILTSGDPNVDGASRAVTDGAWCCLAKPVGRRALLETVEQAINQRRDGRLAGGRGGVAR